MERWERLAPLPLEGGLARGQTTQTTKPILPDLPHPFNPEGYIYIYRKEIAMVTDRALTKQEAGVQAISKEPQPLTVSPKYVEETKKSLAILQEMVRDILVDGRDYGHIEGIPGKFLWDPGASQIISSFNCYAGHRRVLSLVDDGSKIAVVLEVPLIHRGTLQEVGSGVGASSTMETKHNYRWVTRPEDWGIPSSGVASLKKRTNTKNNKTEYQIVNPEHEELLNVIVKQASKRAEVDAAESLPGVASVLKEMFTTGTAPSRPKVDQKIAEAQRVSQSPRRDPDMVTEEEIRNGTDLQRAMHECFGWQPSRVWAESNYRNQKNFEEAGIETAWQLFKKLVPVAKEQERQPDKE
jgi:hypothetical protein